jgi:hypothetical protein
MKALLAIALILISTNCFSQYFNQLCTHGQVAGYCNNDPREHNIGIGFKAITDTTIRTSCIAIGRSAFGASTNFLIGNTAGMKITTGTSCVKLGYDYPAFKEEKCIVIYLDGLEVKADSCTKIYKADTTTYEYHNPNTSFDIGNGLSATTCIGYIPQVVPDWYVFKVIRKNKKEIALKDIIQYK